MTNPIPVEHRPADLRFTADVGGGEHAVLLYQPAGDHALDLQHTIVPEDAQGEGVADALVHAAVAYARAHGVRLIATCAYVRAWVRRHPDERAVFEGEGD